MIVSCRAMAEWTAAHNAAIVARIDVDGIVPMDVNARKTSEECNFWHRWCRNYCISLMARLARASDRRFLAARPEAERWGCMDIYLAAHARRFGVRPASSPDGDVLLRPAGTVEGDEDRLLRPGEEE